MSFWADCSEFWGQFKSNFQTTGAILPSGRFLARSLASGLRLPRPPARILEVGPGTGSVTREILRRLQPQDRLTAVEINSKFIRLLHRRFEHDRFFVPYRGQVELIEGPIEQMQGSARFDYIISGLPLNNFTPGMVRGIFRTFVRLLRPGGTLTYFEYVLVRQLKTAFTSQEERRRLLRVGQVVNKYIRDYQFSRKRVLVNVPPAVVRHLRFKQEAVPELTS